MDRLAHQRGQYTRYLRPVLKKRWGGESEVFKVDPGPNDDAEAHVLAGDIFSPDLTCDVVEKILDWIKRL